jgi:hypothetical protein
MTDLLDELEGYLRVSRCGGMPKETAEMILSTVRDFLRVRENNRAILEAIRKDALDYFAKLDAMKPPDGVPLNEWLGAVTGARAALRDR